MTLMNSSKPFLVAAFLLPLLSCATDNGYRELNFYDHKMIKTPEGKRWPPWIPGTEGQKEVKVQVLDATTMKPIEGAIVVGGYYALSVGTVGGGGGDSCIKSESAVSDAEGWATLPNDQDPRIGNEDLRGPRLQSAYKRGYQMVFQMYYATSGGNNEWYVRKLKPKPMGDYSNNEGDVISTRKFSLSQKDALLETKERSTIYLMPSTAKTKEERWEELTRMASGGCSFTMPFKFSESEGWLAAQKAVYQEMLEIGYPENIMRTQREYIAYYGKSLHELRQRTNKEKLQ